MKQPQNHSPLRHRLISTCAIIITLLFCLMGSSELTGKAQGINATEPKPGQCVARTINPAALPDGAVGAAYVQLLSASNHLRHKFSLLHGALPPGLQLSIAGQLTGTPTTAGSWKFTVVATDEKNCFALREYTLKIVKICAPITLFPTVLPDAQVGQEWSVPFSATGGTKPYQFMIIAGALPGWAVPVSGSDQHIEYAGTPSLPGVYTFTLRAMDSSQCTTQRSFTLTVHESPWPQPQQIAESPDERSDLGDEGREARHRRQSTTDRAGSDQSRAVTAPTEVTESLIAAGDQAEAMTRPTSPLALISATPTPVTLKSGYIPPVCYPLTRSNALVDCWLMQHPNIAKAIVWQFDANSLPKAYPQWERQAKEDLVAAFGHARAWFHNGMTGFHGKLVQDPPPNLTDPMIIAGQYPPVIYSKEDAWGIYLGHVGLDLALEIDGLVPWSLRNYEARALDHLFNATKSMEPDNTNNGGVFVPSAVYNPGSPDGYRNMTGFTPANATYVFKFLKENDLLGPTPQETIARLLKWSGGLTHFMGGNSYANYYNHWQNYTGQTVSRTIEGTVNLDPNYSDMGKRHWTKGCSGTTSFLAWVLRAANIPAKSFTILTQQGNGHAGIWFSGEDLYMSHGDSPYDKFAEGYPPEQLLLSQQTFNSWFKLHDNSFTTSDYANNLKNIDRRVTELAIRYPGAGLVKDYCQDLKDKNAAANSNVYRRFKPFYSVEQLKAWGLWDRLEQKAIATGACQP